MVDDSVEKLYLLPNHSSLLPASTRAIVVLKIYMLLVEEMPNIDTAHANLASTILAAAAKPYMTPGNHWYDICQNDTMLSNWLNYRGERMYTGDERSLMLLHRHVTHYSLEHQGKSPTSSCTYEAIQNLLEHTFPDFISRLQFLLWDNNILKPLRLHTLFTASPHPYDG
uniref:Uncharacterized protein n=1 Tax=Setaria viridis TaxID=4556 RepID=A0A4U6VEM4_SETVI|nr:hypothetical protein SEVIR_3G184700v2 [Setaria viridis]